MEFLSDCQRKMNRSEYSERLNTKTYLSDVSGIPDIFSLHRV